jgi:cinnamoyl-CoA reductase
VIWRNCFVIVGVYIFKFFFCSRQLQPEMIDLEVRGTLNVVEACSNAAVNRLVLTSSLSAMVWDQHRNSETVPAAGACIDEKCWSNLDFCRSKKVLEY